jgi:predicted nucleotidyltransferase
VSDSLFVQPDDPRRWIESVALPQHAAVLLQLYEAVEADERIRALRVRGSLARGTADERSDIDTRMWIADDAYEAVLAELPALARSFGPTIDVLFETPGSPYLFVQYADGVQLELSTDRASDPGGRDHPVVVLLDRAGLWARPYDLAPPWDERLWLGWAWMAVADVEKHLGRGSVWEALVALEKARSLLLRHHALATGMHDPEYGITSIVDYGGTLPEGLDATVAGLDADEIRRATCACGELLEAHGTRPFADYVLARLRHTDAGAPASR